MATKAKTKSNDEKEKRKIPPITIENAKLMYKNFAGSAKKFNAKGLRNFHVILNRDIALALLQDGWNIKIEEPKEEGDLPIYHIKVAVRFDNYPPRIVLIAKDGRSVLNEDTVDILDWAEIETADIVLTGSPWSVNGETGIKAYLRKAFITLSSDDLESKYATAPSTRQKSDEDDD